MSVRGYGRIRVNEVLGVSKKKAKNESLSTLLRNSWEGSSWH
ncbi:hypothetical protein [Lacticaseibacillus camelliae]|nr:hypothetical protein [Lacticaseibacillus camelliae]